jgi:hypothetical protein
MKKLVSVIALLTICLQASAQELLDLLEEEMPQTKNYVFSTFKGTRILNGHSIENRKKKALEFVISHRFGRLNLGIEELFGLDQSNIRFAFEYGLSDNLMLGIGRSSFEKTYDAFFKQKLIKQSTGEKSFPFSISLFGSAVFKALQDFDPADEPSVSERLSYTSQLLIASKLSSALSLQITPTYIHRNTVRIDEDPHNIFAIGFGNRIKLGNRVSINGEYYYTFNQLESINTRNSLAVGIDIETGGHVFQIIFSNSITMIEKSFITETTGDFFGGDIHFGFNISRTFQTGNHKKKKVEEMREAEKL